jgi:hypothetical protein
MIGATAIAITTLRIVLHQSANAREVHLHLHLIIAKPPTQQTIMIGATRTHCANGGVDLGEVAAYPRAYANHAPAMPTSKSVTQRIVKIRTTNVGISTIVLETRLCVQWVCRLPYLNAAILSATSLLARVLFTIPQPPA